MGVGGRGIGIDSVNPVGPLGTVSGGRMLGSGKSRPTIQDDLENGWNGLDGLVI